MLRLDQFINSFTPHGFEGTPKILKFSDTKLTDAAAIKKLKHDFSVAIHTRRKNLRDLFIQMSHDNRQGKVTRAELKSTLNKFGIAVGNDRAADLLFNACDVNNDGIIGYSELSRGLKGIDAGKQKLLILLIDQ